QNRDNGARKKHLSKLDVHFCDIGARRDQSINKPHCRMKRILTHLMSIALLWSGGYLSAQQGTKVKIDTLPELPAPGPEGKSLGYAGMLGGRHQQVLLAAGGANFPDGPPW